jgi:hypothetical protein
LAVALLAHALSSTTFFWLIDRAWHRPGSYADFRREHALLLPIDRLAPALDEALGPSAPIVLTTRLRTDEASSQRLAEGLYPRRLAPGAMARLGLARDGELPQDARPLHRQANGGLWYLVGAAGAAAAHGGGSPQRTEVAWLDLLGGLATVLLLGAPVGIAYRRIGLGVPIAILGGALAVGLVFSLATWTQIAVAPWHFAVLGVLAIVVALAPRRLGDGGRAAARLGLLEYGCMVLLVGALLIAQLRLPQTGWDARSIWLFHAKQLVANGRMLIEDLRNPYYAFSHPEYPLLFPGWLAVHAGRPYDERMANASIPFLFGALAWVAWGLLRARLARLPAAAVAVAAALALQRNAALGYADAHIALLLLIQTLALQRRETLGLGYLAAACASLLKLEGLVLAMLVSAASLALRRARPWAAAVAHLPGVVSLAFARGLGLTGDFPSLAWGSVEAEPLTRAQTVAGVASDFVLRVPVLAEGAALGLLALLILALRWRPHEASWRNAALGVGLACAFLAVIFGALWLTPREVVWHARRSLDRVLLHPALLLLVAPFLALAEPTASGAAPGSATPPGPD